MVYATQNQNILDWFKETRNGSVVWYESPMTVSFDMAMEALPGKIGGAISLYLLSECDDLIIHDGSSYGSVAAARGAKMAVTCTSYQLCMRRISATPTAFFGSPIHKAPCFKQTNSTFKLVSVDMSHRFFGSLWKEIEQDGKNLSNWRKLDT